MIFRCDFHVRRELFDRFQQTIINGFSFLVSSGCMTGRKNTRFHLCVTVRWAEGKNKLSIENKLHVPKVLLD